MSAICCDQLSECPHKEQLPDQEHVQLSCVETSCVETSCVDASSRLASGAAKLPLVADNDEGPIVERAVVRPALFNRMTILLLSGWVGIVAFAFEAAAGDTQVAALPALDVFLRSLL